MAIVFMLSGQGSQYYQMGKELFEKDNYFRRHLSRLDEIVQGVAGFSVVTKIYHSGKSIGDAFDNTIESTVSLACVELATVRTLEDYSISPDILLGSSLGAMVANFISSSIADEVIIKSLYRHAKAMQEQCQPGCMLAILDSLDCYSKNNELRDLTELAAVNFQKSFALSMPLDRLEQTQRLIRSQNLAYQQLPVSRAYHSQWIDNVRDAFLESYSAIDLSKLTIPLYCVSHRQQLHESGPGTLWSMVRLPLYFEQTINELEESGPHDYIDVGPSGTLATFTKYALPGYSQSKMFQIMSPFGGSQRKLNDITQHYRGKLR